MDEIDDMSGPDISTEGSDIQTQGSENTGISEREKEGKLISGMHMLCFCYLYSFFRTPGY